MPSPFRRPTRRHVRRACLAAGLDPERIADDHDYMNQIQLYRMTNPPWPRHIYHATLCLGIIGLLFYQMRLPRTTPISAYRTGPFRDLPLPLP